VIFVMVKVPKDLSGASLLGVHNWVKGNIARTNPGASPDYTITDTKGDRLTLSDVARNAGRDVNIEVTTVGSVRTNPPSNLTMIPGMDILYPNMTRGGNNLSDLLPDEIDSAMATRIVAEQGLHRGLHTLNRMSLTQYNKQISTPTTAALLQMGELIKKNPSDRTPFTQRTPLQYGSEKALQQWLVETSGATEKTISEANTEVEDAKIHAKYGLNTQDITKFAQEVLSDYLMVASSNRGLIRTIIRNTADLRDNRNAAVNRETIQKLSYMFPTQPSSFYEGTQRAFAARTPFMYPAYAESILSNRQIQDILNFARDYPRNMTITRSGGWLSTEIDDNRGDVIPRGMRRLTTTENIINPFQDLRAFLTQAVRRSRSTASNDVNLDAAYTREGHLQTIIAALAADPRDQLRERDYKPFRFYEDLGGFYPTPPPKWPRKLMYAIMDGFLENLPHIINMDDPVNSNLTPVQMAYFSEPTVVDSISVPSLIGSGLPNMVDLTIEEANSIIVDRANFQGEIGPVNSTEQFYALPAVRKLIPVNKQDDVLGSAPVRNERRGYIVNEVNQAIARLGDSELNLETSRSELTFDAAGPKSIIEMVYDIAEIATSKYDYNMRGDDFKFTMSMVHYSFEALKTSTQGMAFGLANRLESNMRNILGGDRSRRLHELLESIDAREFDEDVRAQFTQQIFISLMMELNADHAAALRVPMTSTTEAEVRAELMGDYRAVMDAVNERNRQGILSQQFLSAAQVILSEMLNRLEGRV
jgi:hypothetical protein